MEKKRFDIIPARHVVTILGCLGLMATYMLRTNMSVTIMAMVNESLYSSEDSARACPKRLSVTRPTNATLDLSFSAVKGKFLWDSNTQGWIFSSFFIGFTVSQIPGGVMAEKFGGKRLVAVGVLMASLSSFLIPIAAQWNVWAIIVIRFIQGFFEGFVFVAMNTLISRWAPKMERSRISTIILLGTPIGIVLSFVLSGVLSGSNFLGGWPSVFYVFGGIGCIWLILWHTLVYEKPEDHPRISTEELDLIQMGRTEAKQKSSIPWKEIFTSLPVWALVIAHFGQNWGFITLVTELPTYMSNVLHFDIEKSGVMSSAPHLVKVFCGLVASYIADFLRKNNYLRITNIRKIMNTFGFFGCGICLLSVTFVGCQSETIVLIFILSMVFNSSIYSGFFSTHVDMSPEYAGVLMGITGTVANLTGFIVPLFVGKVVEDGQTLYNWSIVFITTSAMFFVCGTIFILFGSAELQPWNTPSTETKKEDNIMKSNLEINDSIT